MQRAAGRSLPVAAPRIWLFASVAAAALAFAASVADAQTVPQTQQNQQSQTEAQTQSQATPAAQPQAAQQLQQALGQPQASSEQLAGTTAAPAPSQSGGAQQAAVSAGLAGVPLSRARSLVGTKLVGPNGRDVGQVDNLVIDGSGNVRAAVVQWGGFLGLGARSAVVPINDIQFGAGGNNQAHLNLNMTREQLEALPTYDPINLNQYSTRYGWGSGVRLYR